MPEPTTVSSFSIFAPAKVNLFLAVTGRRPDGFHDLVSVVAPLRFGDVLHVQVAERFELECDDPNVPRDDSNLVLKAAATFAREVADKRVLRGAKFVLEKRIPIGAGLGGGSSNAVAALRGLNRLTGAPVPAGRLAELAAQLGSDCPLFLHDGPVIMRGRGERIEPLPEHAASRLHGRRVLVFKPAFGIATPWAYGRLAAAAPRGYLAAAEAETRLSAWINDGHADAEDLLFNNLEAPAFAKFVALPALLDQLKSEFGLRPRMSGSGSACFALLPDTAPVLEITSFIRAAWGDSAFVIETALA